MGVNIFQIHKIVRLNIVDNIFPLAKLEIQYELIELFSLYRISDPNFLLRLVRQEIILYYIYFRIFLVCPAQLFFPFLGSHSAELKQHRCVDKN